MEIIEAVARLEEQNKTIFATLGRIETNLSTFITRCDDKEVEQRKLIDSVVKDNVVANSKIGMIVWIIGGIITVLVGLILKVVKVI